VAPALSPFVPRADAPGRDSASSVDLAVGKETLSDILRESAEDVASLTKALQV
jgi:hypothetical protein